jgi:two-component system response regulator RegX3
MARVLVIEERDAGRASTLLTEESFTVMTAVETSEAIEALGAFGPDVVVVEVATPSSRVVQLCGALRAAGSTPLLVLSGPCSERDVIATFGAGADSVVIEPVGSHELVARIRALVRRNPVGSESAQEVITVGPVRLDLARRELTVRGERVPVPRREFDIAELLMQDAGRVVPRRVIVRELWGSMRDTKSLDVQVGRLRTRLANAAGCPCIVTVRGLGFRFASEGELKEALGEDFEIDLTGIEDDERAVELVSRPRSAESR